MGRNNLLSVGLDAMDELLTGELEDAINIIEWGKWSRGGIPTGVQPDTTTPNISDDDAMLIDAQVAKLPRKPKMIIVDVYIGGRGINELASNYRKSNRAIMSWRDQGLNIIYGALCEKP